LERLEDRDVPSGVQPDYIIHSWGGATPFGSGGPTGTTPTQIRHAYGFDQLSYTGSGTTIAIVDAYDDPNIVNDLQGFDKAFSLPDPTFTGTNPTFKKINENGGTSLPAANSGWISEIALDVEWAHAIAPGAGILLVEANSNSFSDLLTAVSTAAKQTNVVAVSMSWGGGEFSGETSYDSTFTTPSGHGGVTFVASSGDAGAPASYPAISPNVLSVGGTTLNMDASGNILSESGWSGSGGGISTQEAQPSYQHGVVTQSTTKRTNPDVAYDADPNTGFPVYDSYNNGTAAPWSQFGGTSDAAPQWAALIALADQGRIAAGLGALDGPSGTLPKLYSVSASDYHDITTGTSTGSPHYSAGPGYDLVTGRGTPVANKLVADLVGQNTTVGATHFSVTAAASSMAGNSFTVTVTALDANNNPVPSYAGTVHFTSSDSQAGLPPDTTLANGTGNFSVTLRTAGSQTVTVTDTANGSITGSATVSVSPASASTLVFGQQPGNTAPGAVISPAVTVRVLDAYNNLVTSDNSDQVTLAIGNNPGAGTLNGTTTMTVSGGVATFSNLSINNAGNGYTLTASSGSLTGATSSSFNVSAATANVIEGFENNPTYNLTGFGNVNAVLGTYAAHDGTYGLDMWSSQDWIYRNDSAVQVKAGDTISVWLQFAGSTDGRAYFGFGSSSSGTLSLVAAPNTGQLILQRNLNYGFSNLAAVSQSYQANHWYRLEVDWGTSGKIIGKLFDSNGTTLLRQVSATTTAITSGGIAFRATGSDKYFDTVTDTSGVNNFAVPVTGNSGTGSVVIGPPRFWEGGSQFLVAPGGRAASLTTADQLFAVGPKNWHRATGLLGTSEWGGWF
jgi:subtilase family serine protease